MEKKSFLIYLEYEEQLSDLTDEELGKLIRAIFDYERDGTEPKFTGLLKMAFAFIKGNLNRDREKYDKRCVTSAINGAKGGRPKNEKPNSKPNLKPKKPKKADIDNDDDIDNDVDNDIDDDADIYDFFSSAFGYCISPFQAQKLKEWLNVFDSKIIKFAIEKCCNNNAKSFSYLEGILQSWKAKGFKSLEECQKEKKKKTMEPDWFNENVERKEIPLGEKNDMEEMLKEYK